MVAKTEEEKTTGSLRARLAKCVAQPTITIFRSEIK